MLALEQEPLHADSRDLAAYAQLTAIRVTPIEIEPAPAVAPGVAELAAQLLAKCGLYGLQLPVAHAEASAAEAAAPALDTTPAIELAAELTAPTTPAQAEAAAL